MTTGFWVGAGARDEAPAEAGASHFLEHLLFKGTEARTASQIAEAVDAVGGEMNAFTTHEHTAYYTRLPAGHLELGLDILSDVLWAPAFRPHEIEAERQVILEELHAEEDSPDDRVLTLLGEALFPDHPLGREVLGTPETIAAMSREQIRAFHTEWYRPSLLVVAAAGDLSHEQVVDGVVARFAGGDAGKAPDRHPPLAAPKPLVVLRRRTEQVHIAVGVRALSSTDPHRYALAVANQVLGGGMSSRLFQTIREERGLAYSVYSYTWGFSDCGAMAVYAGTAASRAPEVMALLHEGLDRIADGGVTEAELSVAKGYLEGSLLLGLEDSGGCMGRIGRSVLVHGEVTDAADVVERYRAVTTDDVQAVLQRVLGSAERTTAVLGPVSRTEVARWPGVGGPS